MSDTGPDDLPTTLSIGVLASVAQFLVHEVGGHAAVCALLGGRVLAVAPLWMRCSSADPAMVLAGPLANVLAGAACWALLRWRAPSGAAARLFLWLSIAFQWLVAAGYLAVGAASGFGDWPVLLPSALTGWPGRVVAIGVAVGCYLLALRALARLGVERLGPSLVGDARLRALALLPSVAAAAVAVLAELAGRRSQVLGIALALGCTAAVGASLLTLPRFVAGQATSPGPGRTVPRATGWIVAGAGVAAGFIVLVGPAFGA
jgi:hypothetical protein